MKTITHKNNVLLDFDKYVKIKDKICQQNCSVFLLLILYR